VLSAPSPLDEGLLSTIEKTSEEFWRGVPVVPVMSAAGSDGTYFAMLAFRPTGIPGLRATWTTCAPTARTSASR
jgi:hypothetical protein